MTYLHFTAKDFVLDAYFQRWILQPDTETISFWETWLLHHPEKRPQLAEARQILLGLRFQSEAPAPEKAAEIWLRIQAANQMVSEPFKKKNKISLAALLSSTNNYKYLAVFFVLLSISLAVYQFPYLLSKYYKTAYAQTQNITLPDGSEVILNGHSELTHSRFWSGTQPREVWLKGEAFFTVTHTRNKQKFLVHTSDKVTIEVLGTRFNVNDYQGQTKVILNQGKVKVLVADGDKNTQVLMKPGELVSVPDTVGRVIRKVVNPENYSAWTQKKLIFDGTSMAEVVTVLQDTYGLAVKVADPQLLKKKLWGSTPSDDVDLLLTALSKSFNLKIIKNKNQVMIQNNDDELHPD